MAKEGRNNTIDLVNGPIFSSLIRFAIPILFGSIVTQFYNVADSMIVGRFISSEALAAVSASTPIVSIINLFAIGLSSGSNVVIAQRVGSGDRSALQKAVSRSGPLLLVIRCACGARSDLGRPTVSPVRNRNAFMEFLKDG